MANCPQLQYVHLKHMSGSKESLWSDQHSPPPQPHFKQNKFQSKGAGKGTKTKIAFNEMNDVFFYYVCRNQETFGFYSQLDAVHESSVKCKSLSKWNSFPTHGLAKWTVCFPDIVSNESSSAKLIFFFWLVFNLCHLKCVDSDAISIVMNIVDLTSLH